MGLAVCYVMLTSPQRLFPAWVGGKRVECGNPGGDRGSPAGTDTWTLPCDRRTLGGAFWAQVWDTTNFGTPPERAWAAAPGWQGVNLKDRRSNFSLTVNWSPHSFGHYNVQTLLVAQPSHNRKSTHFSTTALLQERYICYA